MSHTYGTRDEAFEHLKDSLPEEVAHTLDSSDGRTLVDLMFEGLAGEPLLRREADGSAQSGAGHGAYIRRYRIVVSEKRAAIVLAAVLVDAVLTAGLATVLVSQVMQDPVFVRRLASREDAICVIATEAWRTLSHDDFVAGLEGGQCKRTAFDCRHRDATGRCQLTDAELESIVAEFTNFLEVA